MRDRAVGRERERMLSNGNSNFEMKGDVNVGKFQKEHGLGEPGVGVPFQPSLPTLHSTHSIFYVLHSIYLRPSIDGRR